ncbi:hypothetical protein QC334_06340 [Streptomyces sp. DH18]|uniref:hypothetical protein n=1 Tax=Streptomyces sp. DH18 TaxID=3040126 RepID=UPI002442F129|nr:hypothetical protein [Streptomyces sp. DH18]MDG9682361.1 hypothetical protein [Streptomyces sp. DH18]
MLQNSSLLQAEGLGDALRWPFMVDGGRLHEVIYRTPADSVEEASRRNDRLFVLWTGRRLDRDSRQRFRQDLSPYRSAAVRALWSYAMDITTFGTMGFHQVK